MHGCVSLWTRMLAEVNTQVLNALLNSCKLPLLIRRVFHGS